MIIDCSGWFVFVCTDHKERNWSVQFWNWIASLFSGTVVNWRRWIKNTPSQCDAQRSQESQEILPHTLLSPGCRYKCRRIDLSQRWMLCLVISVLFSLSLTVACGWQGTGRCSCISKLAAEDSMSTLSESLFLEKAAIKIEDQWMLLGCGPNLKHNSTKSH